MSQIQNAWISAQTYHNPARTEENNEAEDVEHAGCKDSIPGAKEDGLSDKEISFPPFHQITLLKWVKTLGSLSAALLDKLCGGADPI